MRLKEKTAWKVVGDPCAEENAWMAACTVVEGKSPPAELEQMPIGWFTLPLALLISTLTGIGAVAMMGIGSFSAARIVQAAAEPYLVTAKIGRASCRERV